MRYRQLNGISSAQRINLPELRLLGRTTGLGLGIPVSFRRSTHHSNYDDTVYRRRINSQYSQDKSCNSLPNPHLHALTLSVLHPEISNVYSKRVCKLTGAVLPSGSMRARSRWQNDHHDQVSRSSSGVIDRAVRSSRATHCRRSAQWAWWSCV